MATNLIVGNHIIRKYITAEQNNVLAVLICRGTCAPILVKMMCDFPMHTSSQDEPYSTPLEIAATNGHPQTVERLLEGGALVNYQRPVCH